MPWATRGLRDRVLTTRWPQHEDAYFDEFPASIAVVAPGDPDALVDAAIAACPTAAIERAPDGAPRLDRGRCILCGRCAALAPETFAWERGSDVSSLARDALVVGEAPETDESLRALRAALNSTDGSDEWEVQALANPVYDVHRLGIFFPASPRHADILLLTGIGASGMVEPLRRTLEAMPRPIVVIATGAEAISGGIIGGGYMGGAGVGGLVDVDVWVPGSPATPFAILHGILLALDRLPAPRAPERPR